LEQRTSNWLKTHITSKFIIGVEAEATLFFDEKIIISHWNLPKEDNGSNAAARGDHSEMSRVDGVQYQ